jgi:hypothetical protein
MAAIAYPRSRYTSRETAFASHRKMRRSQFLLIFANILPMKHIKPWKTKAYVRWSTFANVGQNH